MLENTWKAVVWNREWVLKELWVHGFIHTLGTFPKALYVQEEIRRQTRNWDNLDENFVSFRDNDRRLTEALHAIKQILLTLGQLWDKCIDQRTLQYFDESGYPEAMTCGKVDKESNEDDLEGLRHLQFHEVEGERGMKEGLVTDAPHLLPVNFAKAQHWHG